MTDDEQRTAIGHELRHGRLALDAARQLRDAGLYNDALSRLYYAVFHSTAALLLSAGVEPRRHRSVPGLLGTHFPTALGAADLATVARAATYRDLADYERTWEATREIVDQAFGEAEPLIDRVGQLLAQGGWTAPGA